MTQVQRAEMRAQRESTFTLYTAPVADRRKESRYEVTIHGAPKLVEAVFGEAGVWRLPPRENASSPGKD